MDSVGSGISNDETDSASGPDNSAKRDPNLGKVVKVMGDHGVIRLFAPVLFLDALQFRTRSFQFVDNRGDLSGIQNRRGAIGESRYMKEPLRPALPAAVPSSNRDRCRTIGLLAHEKIHSRSAPTYSYLNFCQRNPLPVYSRFDVREDDDCSSFSGPKRLRTARSVANISAESAGGYSPDQRSSTGQPA
jgi:hypothetical protein